MQCKYCQMELEDGVTVCPQCGESQEESKVSKQLKLVKIMLASLVSLILLAVLVGVLYKDVTGMSLLSKNDLHVKESYTVSKEKLETESGYKSYAKKMDAVVATFGEYKLTNRMLQIYYWQLVGESSYKDLDKNKPLDTQYQDLDTQTTWEQFFIEEAITVWQEDMAQFDMAAAAGYQMPESYSSQFATLKADLEQYALMSGCADTVEYLEKNFGKGVDVQTFYDYRWNYYYGGLYCAEQAEKAEPTQEQIEAYFTANQQDLATGIYGIPITKESGKLVDVRHILVKITGGTTDENGKTVYSDEDWEACRVKAQAILDEWQAGEKTEDSFALLATEKTEDSGSKQNGGLYEYVYPGQMVEPFEAWCFDEARKTGDTGLVKTTYGYHVMFYVYGEEGWIRVCEEGAKAVVVDERIQQAVNSSECKVNYKKIVIGAMQ